MPTYDYVCRACNHAFEAFHSITADPIRVCPSCAEERVERLISGGGGLLFKGSGFYETDYRSSSYQEAARADSGDSGSSSEKSEAKSDSAPAASAAAPSSASDSSSSGSTSDSGTSGSSGTTSPASSTTSSS